MSLLMLPTYSKEGGGVHVVVESPKGSSVKLKYDPELGAFMYSRALPLGVTYPYDWGFVPGTEGPDGDPIDAMVLSDAPSATGVVVPCKLIGVVEVEQKGERGKRERNDRVITAPIEGSAADVFQSDGDVPKELREHLKAFFESAVRFEGKELEILGWKGSSAAAKLIKGSLRRASSGAGRDGARRGSRGA